MLSGGPSQLPSDFSATVDHQIRETIASGGTQALTAKTEALQRKARALEYYEAVQYRTAEAIGKATGTKPAYEPNAKILRDFDALMAKGGAHAVHTATDKSKAYAKAADAYVSAREDQEVARTLAPGDADSLSVYKREGLYRPDISAGNLPPIFTKISRRKCRCRQEAAL